MSASLTPRGDEEAVEIETGHPKGAGGPAVCRFNSGVVAATDDLASPAVPSVSLPSSVSVESSVREDRAAPVPATVSVQKSPGDDSYRKPSIARHSSEASVHSKRYADLDWPALPRASSADSSSDVQWVSAFAAMTVRSSSGLLTPRGFLSAKLSEERAANVEHTPPPPVSSGEPLPVRLRNPSPRLSPRGAPAAPPPDSSLRDKPRGAAAEQETLASPRSAAAAATNPSSAGLAPKGRASTSGAAPSASSSPIVRFAAPERADAGDSLAPESEGEQRLLRRVADPAGGVSVLDRRRLFKTYKQCFLGRDLVDWLVNDGAVKSRDAAVRLAASWLERKLVGCLSGDGGFRDDSQSFYVFEQSRPRPTASRPSGPRRAHTMSRVPTSREKVTSMTFHKAITDGDVGLLSLLLQPDVKYALDETDAEGQCPLHAAVRSNSSEIVEMFLDYYRRMHLDVNVKDSYGWTPLHMAVYHSTGSPADDEILSLLLNFPGVVTDAENRDLNTPLHFFCQKYISATCTAFGEALIEKSGSNIVNKRNKSGETPLHKAIMNHSVRVLMVKLLIKHGADVSLQNRHSAETALHYAVYQGRKDLVKILLYAGADTSLENARGQAPLALALATGQREISQILGEAKELRDWLDGLQLSEYFPAFLKEDLFLDTLASASDAELDAVCDKMGVTSLGHRLKLKASMTTIRERASVRKFEAQLDKAQQRSVPLLTVGTEQAGQLRQDLTALMPTGSESNWLIPHSAMEFTEELGIGTSGKVFKGLYQGQKVAIKVLKAVDTVKEFKKELHIMGVLRSPYIVHFYGACLSPKICLVMEYCAFGSLNDVLRRPDLTITWPMAARFAVDMARGMNALHSWTPPVFHRDMKSLNLLVTKSWQVKLCDFGLSRFDTTENVQTMSKTCGTFHYLSPELFGGMSFTAKSDVWAMGIVLWEVGFRVSTGRYATPYHEYGFKMDFQIPYQVAVKGVRPTPAPNCPAAWNAIVDRCLDLNHETRICTPQLEAELLTLCGDFERTHPATALP